MPLESVCGLDFDLVINKELDVSRRQVVCDLLKRYSDCFAVSKNEFGRSNMCEHVIDTGDSHPVHQHPYPSAWKAKEVIQGQVNEMLEAGVIEHSNSPWASPVVLVKKKDGNWRFCVDYRKVNAITKKDVYPLPRVEDALSKLEGSFFFSLMDLQMGYWQIGVRPEDRAKTAFITADGLFQFKVMPFGLVNAPSTFQRMMDVMLAGLKWNACLVYLDDVVVFAPSFDQHLSRLEAVLTCFRKANLRLKLSKCSFLQTTINYLGHVVSQTGISPDPGKISAVKDFPVPTNVKGVQSFVGLCSYYRKFIKGFAEIAKPLTDLTKQRTPFVWSNTQQTSFDLLRRALISPPILAHPDYTLPFIIHCDACNYGMGAVLLQQIDGVEKVIMYASRLLDSAEINYSASEKECSALNWAVDKFDFYIWGSKVKIVTDHHALCWLLKKKNLAGRLARWSLKLQGLDLEIVYRSGRLHLDADGLSRGPVGCPETEEEIPMLLIGQLPSDSFDIRTAQGQTNWCKDVIAGLDGSRKLTRKTRKLINNFVLKKGVLFRRFISRGCIFDRLCVPPCLIEQILLSCHDDITAGHLGTTRTVSKIRQRYFWPGMNKQIISYVLSCIDCQTKKKPLNKPAGLLKSIAPGKPFERMGIYLIGPFPLSKSGNRHTIVAVDYLTKWVITKAVPTADSKELVNFLVHRVVLQHGAPTFLISDRGKCLTSSFSKQLYDVLQTNHLTTTAYHPQCNGLVERFNHTFAEMLSMYVSSSHNDWDETIDFVTFAYNTSRQESTGYTPFYLLYGREAVLPVDVALGNDPNPILVIPSEEGVVGLIKRLSVVREKVKRRLLAVQLRQKKRYDGRRKTKSFEVGEQVLVYRPTRKKGRSEKLLHQFHGPFTVVKKGSDLTYFVRLSHKHKGLVDAVHVSRMKSFKPRTKSNVTCDERQLSPLIQSVVSAPVSSTTNIEHTPDSLKETPETTILRDEMDASILGGGGTSSSWSRRPEQSETTILRGVVETPALGGGGTSSSWSRRLTNRCVEVEGLNNPRPQRTRKPPSRLNL